MKTIQKLTLEIADHCQTLTLKQGYKIVRIEYMVTEKRICMWVETPLRADIPQETKTFMVKRTNEAVPSDYTHIHTAVDLLSPEAFHIFELPNKDQIKIPTNPRAIGQSSTSIAA